MTTIQETVQQSLSNAGYGGYMQYAQPVITDLVNREQQICGRLIQFAHDGDLDVDAVRNALVECGLTMPVETVQATENVQAPASDDALAATLGRIEQALSGLTEFARRNGYNG